LARWVKATWQVENSNLTCQNFGDLLGLSLLYHLYPGIQTIFVDEVLLTIYVRRVYQMSAFDEYTRQVHYTNTLDESIK